MGKILLDLISEFVSITGNSTADGIIFAIIGMISFSIAFDFVGVFFSTVGYYNAQAMSDTHWNIRALIFVILTWIGIKITQLIKWLFSFPWCMYVVVCIVFVGIIALAYYIMAQFSKSKTLRMISVEVSKTESIGKLEEQPQVASAKSIYYCPWCHSKLVERYGPYGFFYGCESYGKTGCRYTCKLL